MPCIEQLFDENLLIGSGWTARDTVRSLAYSILADLVHHIRNSLSLPQLSQAVYLFSKNVHDDTFPVSIQTMSCKVSYIYIAIYNCVCQSENGEYNLIKRCIGNKITIVIINYCPWA